VPVEDEWVVARFIDACKKDSSTGFRRNRDAAIRMTCESLIVESDRAHVKSQEPKMLFDNTLRRLLIAKHAFGLHEFSEKFHRFTESGLDCLSDG
jgi:hypothetical protein